MSIDSKEECKMTQLEKSFLQILLEKLDIQMQKNEARSFLQIIHKNSLKYIIEVNAIINILKLLEENIGVNLHYIWLDNFLKYDTKKTQLTKLKTKFPP